MNKPELHIQATPMDNLGQLSSSFHNSNEIPDSIQVLHQMNHLAQHIPNQQSNMIMQVPKQMHPMNLMPNSIPQMTNSPLINQSSSPFTTQHVNQIDLVHNNRNQAITQNFIANHLNQISHNEIIPDQVQNEHTKLISNNEQNHIPQNIHHQSVQQLPVNDILSDDENLDNISPIFRDVIAVPSFEITEPEISQNPPQKDQEKGKNNIVIDLVINEIEKHSSTLLDLNKNTFRKMKKYLRQTKL